MAGAGPGGGLQAHSCRQAASEHRRRREVLGRKPSRRTGGLGRARHLHPAAAAVKTRYPAPMSIPAPAHLCGSPDTPDPTASKRALPLIAMLLGSLGFAAYSVKAEDPVRRFRV